MYVTLELCAVLLWCHYLFCCVSHALPCSLCHAIVTFCTINFVTCMYVTLELRAVLLLCYYMFCCANNALPCSLCHALFCLCSEMFLLSIKFSGQQQGQWRMRTMLCRKVRSFLSRDVFCFGRIRTGTE